MITLDEGRIDRTILIVMGVLCIWGTRSTWHGFEARLLLFRFISCDRTIEVNYRRVGQPGPVKLNSWLDWLNPHALPVNATPTAHLSLCLCVSVSLSLPFDLPLCLPPPFQFGPHSLCH
ncbi:hypothetical protein BDQ94DRAFT_144286 [Aspergillus welwitschiae]|uniref:Uncharacterized protein n=1 Tax=Aspergillus welwitschiae TaxID=1341132 RepID=A0A3F3Q1I0_9EURO|nr:hypothetical protein BDQ94DRAFT_144286 [Aspergillus welwitschiae]RDH33008.1 hypothetical protein BDQ94DRAFT_144286 [Aspergillus welwitschiae]